MVSTTDRELEVGRRRCAGRAEALTPSRVRNQGHRESPLEGSARERPRQLRARWEEAGEPPAAVGRAAREGRWVRCPWARLRLEQTPRRSRRAGQVQELVGQRGVVTHDGVSPLTMAQLILGAIQPARAAG